MKINHLLKTASLALMMCATTTLQAADVNLTTAQNAAKSFLTRQVANGRLKAAAATNLQLVKAEASVAKPTAVDYYIFNADKSYVVIAGDDLAPEVLMYGEEGKLDMNNIPPAMQWLLNKYKYQIDGIKAGTLAPTKAPKFATTPVAPLVNANWDQSAPYNNQCPTSGSSRTLTGCPATSLSMCYYKWKWPETFPAVAAINGSSSGGVSAAALPEREADWDNIIDEYTGPNNYSSTSAQKDAVAWLMRYTGQAIPDYQYGTSASGANDPEIYQGCLNMGYTDAQYLLLTELVSSGWSYTNGPQQYTDAQWNEYMLNELHNGRPIEYLAYDVSGGYSVSGHAFNVFGCDANGKYYVNWGWSGDSNGYCTLHNFTTSTGATGQSGSYVFNYGEAMIIGIEPPAGALTNPRIKVNPTTLTMSTTVGTPKTATVTVTGYNLTDNVNLSLSGDNAFSMSTTSISATQATNGATVTVTYDPSAMGTHEATITLTSEGAETVTVKLNGTADPTPLETYAPVMLDAGNITASSFTATWTDQTPAENVASYTLYVSDKPFKPAVALLDSIDWSTNNSIPTGWSQVGLTYYGSNSACYLSASANGYVQSKTYDLEGYDKMTVRVYASPYNSGNTITVTTSAGSKTVNLPSSGSFAWYTFVVNCASSDYVKLTTTGMPDMRYMSVYAGDLTENQLKASETGDETYRVITGITGKSQTVTGLTQGGSFYFYVVANYTNGTICNSNTQQVTLLESTDPTITVDPATLTMTANTGETATATFNVTGVYLTGNVKLTLTDASGVYSVTPTTISAAEAMSGKDVTVTYAPTVHGSQNATIALSSTGAENVTVNLNGTATLLKSLPVMQPANENYINYTSFRADWTDETPASNVASYTLQVNQYGEPTLVFEETFANCKKDGADISSNLNNYMDNAGWTGERVYESTGGVRLGTTGGIGSITSPALDLTGGTGKISIVFNAKPYTRNNTTDKNVDVKISCGDKSQTITVNEEGEQKIVLDAAQAANQQIQIATTKNGKRVIISALRIYDEDVTEIFNATRREAIDEQGDATTRTITGITNRFYVVNDLTGGGTFKYRVKAVYADGTESGWSNIEHVTLKSTPEDVLLGDVNNDGVVDVTDINILVNIVLGKEQASNYDGRAYINDDEVVDVTDINMVVNIVLGKGNTAQAPRKTASRYQLIKKLNKQ